MMTKPINRLAPVLSTFALPVLFGVGCPTPTGNTTTEGSGQLIEGGEARAFTIDTERSELVVLVTVSGSVCHNHVAEAAGYSWDFSIDLDENARSTFDLTVPVNGVSPDRPALRERFDETREYIMSDLERGQITETMKGELGGDGTDMVFKLSSLSQVIGEGLTAQAEIEFNGGKSNTTVTFDGSYADDELVITGRGVLSGANHSFPSGAGLTGCIDPDVDLMLNLVLVPGESDGPEPEPEPTFEPTYFDPPTVCGEAGGWDEAWQVLGPRCSGCHTQEGREGAAEHFLDYEETRYDTPFAPGRPLVEVFAEVMDLPQNSALHMPPLAASQLTGDERTFLHAWIDEGGPETACTPTAPAWPLTPVEKSTCGTPSYADVEPILAFNCVGCHTSVGPAGYLPLDNYAAGTVATQHPFYAPLTNWEASYQRMLDQSMPPGSIGLDDTDLQLVEAWINAGTPEAPCQ